MTTFKCLGEVFMKKLKFVFPAHLSSSVHHSMSSFPFISTGKCWSFPCLMELERVVIVRTFPNY